MFYISSILSLFDIADTGHCSHAVTLHDYLKVYSSLAPSVTICEWIVDVPNQVELCFFSTATNFASVGVTVAALAAMIIGSALILFLNRLLYRCICPDE